MHQDLTSLSFKDCKFHVVISADVLEHIFDYTKAIEEIYRVLKPTGKFIFTIPFNYLNNENICRAIIKPDKTIEYLKQPVFHGNPVSEKGSLCFYDYGWKLLEEMKTIGFVDVKAHLYYSPLHGHLGSPFFVFTNFYKLLGSELYF